MKLFLVNGFFICKDNLNMEKYFIEIETGVSAVKKALGVCRRVQEDPAHAQAFEKADRSPVTLADLAAQAVITAALLNTFPTDRVVGEEDAGLLRREAKICRAVLFVAGKERPGLTEKSLSDLIDYGRRPFDTRGRFWTVDPIDGTKGFLSRRGYAVALALIDKGIVEVGILGCPGLGRRPAAGGNAGCILFAVRGGGARVLGVDGGDAEQIRRSASVSPDQARLCESVEPSHAAHEIHAAIQRRLGSHVPPVRMDSQAKYGALALDIADIYLRIPRKKDYVEKIWDHAAGTRIIEEAGGRVTDIAGNPLDFSRGETLNQNRGVVATVGGIHDRVLSAIKGVVRKC